MSSPNDPIDVEALLMRIRAEVARRKSEGAVLEQGRGIRETNYASAPILLSPLPLPQLSKPQFVSAEKFRLNDFLAQHDRDFIDAAYRGVLKRDPDPKGGGYFLVALRSGALSKAEILGRLRYSAEGRRHGVQVRGLLPTFAVQHLYRVPIIGGLVAAVAALFRLPRMTRNLQALESYQHQRNAELEGAIRSLAIAADGNERQLAADAQRSVGALTQSTRRSEIMVSELNRQAEGVLAELQFFARHFPAKLASLQTQLSAHEVWQRQAAENQSNSHDLIENAQRRIADFEVHAQMVDRQLAEAMSAQVSSAQRSSTSHETLLALELRLHAVDKALQSELDIAQNSRIRMIERIARVEGRAQHSGPASGTPSALQDQHNLHESASVMVGVESRFERIYFAFEQRFRGSRDDIRARLSYYLPLLRDCVVGTQGATLLDVGCGRGEWLELLRDEGHSAMGIDINAVMADECVERGLNVQAGDAIERLKQMPDNTLGAITGFHIIEHLPLETMLELIEQAHRVVQPGGLVIFETPNPENVVVGACNFYIDPTHQRPVPPPLAQFLVEAAGFVDVAIHRVNANLLPQVIAQPSEEDSAAVRSALGYMRNVFLCAPDYSVVGHVA